MTKSIAERKIKSCIAKYIKYRLTGCKTERLYYKRCFPIRNRYKFMREAFRKINLCNIKELYGVYSNMKYETTVSSFNKFIDLLNDDELKIIGCY